MESPRKHGASERRQRRLGATDSTAEQGPEATRSSSSSLEADGRAIARRPEGVRGARSPAWNLERGPSQGERQRSRASGVHGSKSGGSQQAITRCGPSGIAGGQKPGGLAAARYDAATAAPRTPGRLLTRNNASKGIEHHEKGPDWEPPTPPQGEAPEEAGRRARGIPLGGLGPRGPRFNGKLRRKVMFSARRGTRKRDSCCGRQHTGA